MSIRQRAWYQAAHFHRVEIEPVVVDIEGVSLKSVAQNQAPHRNTGQHFQPRDGDSDLLRTGNAFLQSGMNEVQFRWVDSRMFFRPVSRIVVPNGDDHEGQHRTDQK